ncbi:hypothetical protein L486_07531 [Kwoniella mangroviensis CBS 10435]|uniref:Uncharacterized protein n=1 Tax=Kwoniella mangroviensis CBS 10435 TaxID=1331196 RepID=A0A1B9IGZ5_9TREE|nr:hypothetical protein L486_07531 [Kwoniella mangroviensis CBS 10435]OCF72901.1 hypothetical protein I204_06130 [Kwoniella mangroviensis CBS 8886]
MPLLSLISTIKVKPIHKRTYPLGDSGGSPTQTLRLRGGCASASNIDDVDGTKKSKKKRRKKGGKGLSSGSWMGCGGGGC